MSRPRILFVDDEPSVLGGLRRQLWDRRADWDLAFAPGGAEALALLEQAPADVVVSDMRMPGMDGAALLDAVRKRWPATVRILLTGYTDPEQMLRSARSAHRFLNKPCDPAALREALTQALDLRSLVPDAGLQADLARLVALPLLDGVQDRIQAELDRADASPRRLGDLVEQDPGLSAKLLQLVNSAALGLGQRVQRPAQAVVLLGLDYVRNLWKALQLVRVVKPSRAAATLQEHSEAVGLAVAAALKAQGADAQWGFCAGLMHDIGELALEHCRPEAWQAARGQGRDRERELCGADHAAAGAFLLGLWGVDASVVRAVARHHSAPDPNEPLQAALALAESRALPAWEAADPFFHASREAAHPAFALEALS
jgi:HD-like signal output (HDOD) protein/CheY-like chemotaxis protein